jgi:hypothetical protein
MSARTTPPASHEDDHDGGPGRSGLPPLFIVFIVLDVLLVAIFAWMLVSRLTSGPDEGGASTAEPTQSTSSSATATAPGEESQTGASAAPPIELSTDGAATVASPTGNITCTITPTGVRCGIASLAAEPAPVAGCDGTVGHVVELGSNGVSTPCVAAADTPAAATADIPVLQYGGTETVNNFACESTEAGMRCTDSATGKGFVLARAGVTTL